MFIFYIPESPRLLLKQGKQAEAKMALSQIKAMTGEGSPISAEILLRKKLPKDDDENSKADYRYQLTDYEAQFYNSKDG